MKKVKINGKEFSIKKIDFNAMCELEELGLDTVRAGQKTLSTFRALVAWVMGIDSEEAGVELTNHFKNGGKVDDLLVLQEALQDSDFFKSLQTMN